jgi:23S rRNA pseudouridine2605 synthase
MQIIPFLQNLKWLSRRKIVSLIQDGQIFLNNEEIESFKSELNNWDILTMINEEWDKENITISESEESPKWKLILFNKPKWYVVSKSDPHNNTIYELLPEEFKNRYYIWRLDKDSRGLVLLTDTPALVNQFEHPKFEIEKEYLIQLTTPFREWDKQKVKSWIIDEWEQLKFLDIQTTNNPLTYKVILNEWKKRHIRRVIKHLWYNLVDLQRIKEAQYTLPKDLPEGEFKFIN